MKIPLPQQIQEEDLKAASDVLKAGGVKNIIFSSGTYQIEVQTEAGSEWIFVQCDNTHKIVDAFCMCTKGEKEKSCIHLAAGLSAIYHGHKDPIHVRFEHSLYNNLCSLLAKELGYQTETLSHSDSIYQYVDNKGNTLCKITPHTDEAKEKLLEWIDNREVETEETSLKFSNLDPEELENWRRGRPSHHLKYELSFWSDFAKYLMILEDAAQDVKIEFPGAKSSLPEQIKVSLKDVTLECKVERGHWPELIEPLYYYKTSLPVHQFQNIEIESITYDEKAHKLRIISQKKGKSELKKAQVHWKNWVFVPGSGFYPKKDDPLLAKNEITREEIPTFLDNHLALLEKYLKDTEIEREPIDPSYHLYFDKKQSLHIVAYLFEKDDLIQAGATDFSPWLYLPQKGFFRMRKPLFQGLEKTIPKEFVSEFVDRHKTWLSKFEDFQIHLTSIEAKLSYKMVGNVLKILGDENADEQDELIDFDKWVYVKGQGFYAKKGSLGSEGSKSLHSGIEVRGNGISDFIHKYRDELEPIQNFFYRDSALDKTGLLITLDDHHQIIIEPKHYFRNEALEKSPKVFGDFVYFEGKGFAEIPDTLKIPKKFFSRNVILPDQVPYFINHELTRIRPYILHLDKRLMPPKFLKLEVRKVESHEKDWKLELVYVTNLGELPLSEMHEKMAGYSPFILSPAGMIILKDPKFRWISLIDPEQFDETGSMVTLSTLEWIKLIMQEDVRFAKTHDPEMQKNQQMLASLGESPSLDLPNLKGLKSTLRPYQEIGIRWLWFLYSYGLPGGFLCDDMGLGKTHQAMALITAVMNEKKKSQRKKILVVCPTSVFYHWQDLLEKFLKKGRFHYYHGPTRNTKELKKAHDIILSTYGIVRSDKDLFTAMDFELAIFDEMQVAKNERSQIHHTLKNLNADLKLALTGTPIENHLGELKSLFDIVLPKYLPSTTEFKEQFVQPIEKEKDREKQQTLGALVKPFILRRQKKEVLQDLPEKTEEIAYVELSPEQERLYEEIASGSRKLLEGETDKEFYLHVFALLNQLKRACDHPALIHHDPANYHQYHSGKWDLFCELITEARRSKQKVVVFSQYLEMLDIMEKYLKEEGIGYATIRGATKKRREEVKRFQEDPTCEVFIGSLQAAGVGIDLTAASIVIHYDRWWNPAVENQATDRVHRLGQNYGVNVFKLVTKFTIEEHIHQIIEKKKHLIENIVGYDSEGEMKSFSKDELIYLLNNL